MKCALCTDNFAGEPNCVKHCPNGAIVLRNEGERAMRERAKYVIIGNSIAAVAAIEGIRSKD